MKIWDKLNILKKCREFVGIFLISRCMVQSDAGSMQGELEPRALKFEKLLTICEVV